MNSIDKRVLATKTALQKAILSIMQKKHIDKVTVMELCKEAGVNRGTFYQHYNTPNDVLMEIEQQFMDQMRMNLVTYMDVGYESNYLVNFFSNVMQNAELCRIIMGKNGNTRFLERIRNMNRKEIVDSLMNAYPQCSREDLDYVFDFIIAGSTQLIMAWLQNDQPLSAKLLANRLECLGRYCYMAISEFIKE